MNRRGFLHLLAACPLVGLATAAIANTAFADTAIENPLSGMKRWGSGEFRRYGFLIYEATLWALGNDPTHPPLALKLTYKRSIAGKDIADASVKEIRQLGIADASQLELWGAQMQKLFPDVQAGDHIVGLYSESRAQFFYNDRFIGAIESAGFASAFFGIWLDANTSAPALRSALLQTSSAG